jgi:hypothetical protein
VTSGAPVPGAAPADTQRELSEVLQALNPEILQVYPALVGEEDEGAANGH